MEEEIRIHSNLNISLRERWIQVLGIILAILGPLFMGFVFNITNSSNINNFIFLIMGVLLYIEDTL